MLFLSCYGPFLLLGLALVRPKKGFGVPAELNLFIESPLVTVRFGLNELLLIDLPGSDNF